MGKVPIGYWKIDGFQHTSGHDLDACSDSSKRLPSGTNGEI